MTERKIVFKMRTTCRVERQYSRPEWVNAKECRVTRLMSVLLGWIRAMLKLLARWGSIGTKSIFIGLLKKLMFTIGEVRRWFCQMFCLSMEVLVLLFCLFVCSFRNKTNGNKTSIYIYYVYTLSFVCSDVRPPFQLKLNFLFLCDVCHCCSCCIYSCVFILQLEAFWWDNQKLRREQHGGTPCLHDFYIHAPLMCFYPFPFSDLSFHLLSQGMQRKRDGCTGCVYERNRNHIKETRRFALLASPCKHWLVYVAIKLLAYFVLII